MATSRKSMPTTQEELPVPDLDLPRVPTIGALVNVQPVPGRKVMNLEVGGFFAEGVATPQTVTVTTLRRLADGDLILA